MVFVIISLVVLIGIVFIFISVSKSDDERIKIQAKVQAEHRMRVAREIVKTSNENLSRYLAFIEKNVPFYGMPDKVIGIKDIKNMTFLKLQDDAEGQENTNNVSNNTLGIGYETISITKKNMLSDIFSKSFPSIENIVIVYGEAKMIALKGKLYDYADVLSYEVKDNTNQILLGGKVESTTKTNNSSIIGRGVVGGLVGGATGAIIGASTASKTTTTQLPNQRIVTKHDYSVYVSIRDIANPMLKFHYDNDLDAVQEFVAVLNIVCGHI